MAERTDSPSDQIETVKRTISTDPRDAELELLEIVAELEDAEIERLPSLYTRVDHFVEALFDDPPAEEAQMEIAFSYAGYRISLTQSGEATLVPVKRSMTER